MGSLYITVGVFCGLFAWEMFKVTIKWLLESDKK